MAAYLTLGPAVRPDRRSHSERAIALQHSLSLDQGSQTRALRVLEQACLVSVERTAGRAAQITLILLAQTA